MDCYYVLRKGMGPGLEKITKRLVEMYISAFQGKKDHRVKDMAHLTDTALSLHILSPMDPTFKVPACEYNPAELDCVTCKGFKNYGVCSHVLAINHQLKLINLRRELMEIGESAAAKKAGNHGNRAKPIPALTRAPTRQPDSSDEEEERLLALGAQGH